MLNSLSDQACAVILIVSPTQRSFTAGLAFVASGGSLHGGSISHDVVVVIAIQTKAIRSEGIAFMVLRARR